MDNKELDLNIRNFKKKGNDLYFENIYRYFFKKIYRYILLSINDKQTAESITVDVFFNIYKYLSKIKINSKNFKPWIYKIARNLTIDYFRKEKKHNRNQSLEEIKEQLNNNEHMGFINNKYDYLANDLVSDNLSSKEEFKNLNFDKILKSKITNQKLLKCLNLLPEVQKQVLILRFIEELDYKSIGIIINKSEAVTRAIKFRAILKLKELLSK